MKSLKKLKLKSIPFEKLERSQLAKITGGYAVAEWTVITNRTGDDNQRVEKDA